MNETSNFMTRCLEGARYGKNIGWAVYWAAKDSGCEKDKIFDRPKTPTSTDRYKNECGRWLAMAFPTVFEGLANGKSDKELKIIWINSERNTNKLKKLDAQETEYRLKEDLIRITTKTISARSLSKEHDWNTVK